MSSSHFCLKMCNYLNLKMFSHRKLKMSSNQLKLTQPLQIDNVVKQQVQTDNYVQPPAVVADVAKPPTAKPQKVKAAKRKLLLELFCENSEKNNKYITRKVPKVVKYLEGIFIIWRGRIINYRNTKNKNKLKIEIKLVFCSSFKIDYLIKDCMLCVV